MEDGGERPWDRGMSQSTEGIVVARERWGEGREGGRAGGD